MKPLEETIRALDESALAGLTEALRSVVNPERVATIESALAGRTRYITVLLEDIYRSHNASAVLRTCECFGLQHLHVIEGANRFEVSSKIAQGAGKWVTLHRHSGQHGTRTALQQLKKQGYRLVAMSPDPQGIPAEELPIDAPLALCFGSEEPGLTPEARAMADIAATIPMQGLTRSLNLSVSAGIVVQRLATRVRASDHDWKLPKSERARLRALWLAQSITAGRRVVDRYLQHGTA